ncbi:hypothetical protein LSH36_334g01039 [Paralvinella palmiformis]|uniref:Costars domain-containing protein n=1 Tax=Paralvinella palmiformis TaxID=53620 RepID=A0AAD9JGC0_9ANNE|nr:hypothetical protein LSH36_334g01039 [Paralvinella palmiformis]
MVDDPRLSFQDRLKARTASWQKQHHSGASVGELSTAHTRGMSGVAGQAALWQQRATQHQAAQESNPFSGGWKGPSYVQLKHDDTYGRPPEGSKTEYRGKQAGVHISKEIVELCNVIQELGTEQPNGTYAVTFGFLFETYTRISNKLVGMLMRARKQGLVQFEGEMLFQRRDDDVIIWLLQTPEALMEDIEKRKHQLQEHEVHSDMKK